MRIACLLVLDLPLAAQQRAHPELSGLPLAIVSEAGPRATVLAASSEARRLGVEPGRSGVHARAVCRELRVRVACPALERAARAALLDVALSVSSRAELAPPLLGLRGGETAVYLDAAGSGRLFHSEPHLATALTARAARVGLPATAAVASSRLVARLAARHEATAGGGVRVLDPPQEAAFLAPLPLDFLDLDDDLADDLTRFGLRRVGQLLSLPRHPLATRLGRAGARLLSRLHGMEDEPPLPAPDTERFEEEADFEAPLERLEPLAFALRGMLARLVARLAVRNLAVGTLELALGLEGGGRALLRTGLAAPSDDVRVLLRRLRLALESAPPAAAVQAARLAAEGLPHRFDQLDLFRPPGPPPARLDALLAELVGLCGRERVGAPRVADSHHPDGIHLEPFRVPPPEETRAPASPAATLALRVLRPPVAARVRERAGRPHHVRSAVANGEVVRCAGPWRTTGGWWSASARFAFDQFDVELGDGLLVRLRFDHRLRSWSIDGVYD